MSPCTVTALCLSLPDTLLQDVEMSPVVLMDQVPRPLGSDDKLLDQEAILFQAMLQLELAWMKI